MERSDDFIQMLKLRLLAFDSIYNQIVYFKGNDWFNLIEINLWYSSHFFNP